MPETKGGAESAALLDEIVSATHGDWVPEDVCRAICEELGITWQLVEDCENNGCDCMGGKCAPCRAADALSTLLDAGER